MYLRGQLQLLAENNEAMPVYLAHSLYSVYYHSLFLPSRRQVTLISLFSPSFFPLEQKTYRTFTLLMMEKLSVQPLNRKDCAYQKRNYQLPCQC